MNPRLERLLEKADALLARGEPIPLDLAAALIEAGVDVGDLEAKANR